MSLDDIRSMDCEVLTPAQVAPLIGADPQSIRVTAHANPARLGFPVIICRRRVKIPRLAFIKFMEG